MSALDNIRAVPLGAVVAIGLALTACGAPASSDEVKPDHAYAAYQNVIDIGGRAPDDALTTVSVYHGDFSDIDSVFVWSATAGMAYEREIVGGLDKVIDALRLPDIETKSTGILSLPIHTAMFFVTTDGAIWRVRQPILTGDGQDRTEMTEALTSATYKTTAEGRLPEPSSK